MKKRSILKILSLVVLILILGLTYIQVSAAGEAINYSLGSYRNISYLYVSSDLNNDYYISNSLYSNGNANAYLVKHNIKDNTNEVIYTLNGLFSLKQFVRGSVVYIEGLSFAQYLSESDLTGVRIVGFDTATNQVVYDKTYSDLVVRFNDESHSFVLDSKKNLYFEYDYTGIKAFNSNGTLIFDKAPEATSNGDREYEIVLHNVSPNDDGIIFSKGEYCFLPDNYIKIKNQGYQKLNSNGTFKYNEFTYFDNPNDYISQFGCILDPDWKFINNNYAVNQYGELAKFTYVTANNSNKCGVTIDVVDNTYNTRDMVDSYYGQLRNPVYCVSNNKLYYFGREGTIKVFDINQNFKSLGKYQTGISCEDTGDGDVFRLTNIDNVLYLHYKSNSTGLNLDQPIDPNCYVGFKNIWISDFKTEEHTKDEISLKYDDAQIKYDYSQGLYIEEPSWSAPYSAGELKQGPIDDTLSQLNFYRWLYGVNEVTVRYEKMERSQKGAVIQAAINELTHTPRKPLDMDKDFYKEAYAACNASATPGDYYNGNCAQGDSNPAKTIAGFIDELHNVSTTSSVGHRLNLLDTGVEQTSFGYCNRYTALSMYYDEDGTIQNNELFYPYPTAGYFPNNLFNTNEYLSIYCNGAYIFDDIAITITYNGVEYAQPDFHIERDSAIVFLLPDALVTALGGRNKTLSPDVVLNVKVENIKSQEGNIYNLDYDIKFYRVYHKLGDIDGDDLKNITDSTLLLKYLKGMSDLNRIRFIAADVNKDGDVNITDYTIFIKYLKGMVEIQD